MARSGSAFKYYLVGIGENGLEAAEKFYQGHENLVLFDDRDTRVGEKFADADLIGLPFRVVISDKTLEQNAAEITDRRTGETKIVKLDEFKY